MQPHRLCVALVALVLCSPPAAAQQFNTEPVYGTVTLNTGFQPDPVVVELRAGGPVDVSNSLSPSCTGNITERPSFSVRYRAGDLPLEFGVRAEADTTLVIRTPDGQIICDDDSAGGLNPVVRFDAPRTGRYLVWVGASGQSDLQSASLYVSEVASGGRVVLSELWPVPMPTTDTVLDRRHFPPAAPGQTLTQGRVNDILTAALRQAGYTNRWSYYAAPHGFALVLEAESIRQDNAEYLDPRFGFSLPNSSLVSSLAEMVGVPPGHYRQLVILVTDRNWRPGPGEPPLERLSQSAAEALFDEGARQLPDAYRARDMTSDHRISVLIYEFDKGSQGAARPRTYGQPRNPPREHLRGARLTAFAN